MISKPYGIIPFDKHCLEIMLEFEIIWIPDENHPENQEIFFIN